MTSDILQDDFASIEFLRTAFPFFIRGRANWKRCYFAHQSSWRTEEFHSSCDYKGPSLTIIQVGNYVFGGFVEQSWGGKFPEVSFGCTLLNLLLCFKGRSSRLPTPFSHGCFTSIISIVILYSVTI